MATAAERKRLAVWWKGSHFAKFGTGKCSVVLVCSMSGLHSFTSQSAANMTSCVGYWARLNAAACALPLRRHFSVRCAVTPVCTRWPTHQTTAVVAS